MTTVLCFIDTETTGLDARIHQPYEVSWWREDEDEPHTSWLTHTLEYADGQALRVGRYWDRGAHNAQAGGYLQIIRPQTLGTCLEGVTLVGSNPAFDAAILTRYIGAPVWHHRLINVAEGAMWVFNWERPKGLADVAAECRSRGYEIPEPDHTAEGDVRATRAVYEALRSERARLPR
jgi:hypothetical protein